MGRAQWLDHGPRSNWAGTYHSHSNLGQKEKKEICTGKPCNIVRFINTHESVLNVQTKVGNNRCDNHPCPQYDEDKIWDKPNGDELVWLGYRLVFYAVVKDNNSYDSAQHRGSNPALPQPPSLLDDLPTCKWRGTQHELWSPNMFTTRTWVF